MHHPGYLGSQDTFYVGTMKGVGRIYQQTFIDTYAKVAFAKLYTSKTPITAADLLNGKVEHHDYQLYLAVNDIDHTKTKVRHPQTNGNCERFHKTILQEFYQVTFRKKVYPNLEGLQEDLYVWLDYYNNDRTDQGTMCCGRTPMEAHEDGKIIWQEKLVA